MEKIKLFCGECEKTMYVNPGMDFAVHFCWNCLQNRKKRLKKKMMIYPLTILPAYAILSFLFLPPRGIVYSIVFVLAYVFKPAIDYVSNNKEIEDYEDSGVEVE
jgi:hypothetical protein